MYWDGIFRGKIFIDDLGVIYVLVSDLSHTFL